MVIAGTGSKVVEKKENKNLKKTDRPKPLPQSQATQPLCVQMRSTYDAPGWRLPRVRFSKTVKAPSLGTSKRLAPWRAVPER